MLYVEIFDIVDDYITISFVTVLRKKLDSYKNGSLMTYYMILRVYKVLKIFLSSCRWVGGFGEFLITALSDSLWIHSEILKHKCFKN